MPSDDSNPTSSFDRFSRLKALQRRPATPRPRVDEDDESSHPLPEEESPRLRELTFEPCLSTAAELLASLLGAEEARTEHGRHLSLRALRGIGPICEPTPHALRLLEPKAGHDALDVSRWLFLDTETTGLSSGTGTYPFLIGLGWFEDGLLRLEQHFMRDYDEERSMLSSIAHRIAERPTLVTFNGKSFDWPLLETRFRLSRSIDTPRLAAHLDFLHPARALWKAKFTSAKLSHLERHVLGWQRHDDIPSGDIPGLYQDFVRHGAAHPLVPVFLHNQMDLAGLAAIAHRILSILGRDLGESEAEQGEAELTWESTPSTAQGFDPEPALPNSLFPPPPDALELFALSRLCQRRGLSSHARLACEQSLASAEGSLPAEASRAARLSLARLAKRDGDLARALELWQGLLGNSPEGWEAYQQLAICHEHHLRDLLGALDVTSQALAELRRAQQSRMIPPALYRQLQADFQHRRQRLESRLTRRRPGLFPPERPA